jgi:hypothetical protein
MLDRFERAFEEIVEGSVARAFRLRVQPAEIGRRLERAMLDSRATSVGNTLAANSYEVRLHADDAVEYAEWQDALCREMEAWLAELAYSRGIKLVGPIRVSIASDDQVRRRAVRVMSRFEANPPPVLEPVRRAPRPIRLRQMDSGDAAAHVVKKRVQIGRAKENDIVIIDPTVSRRHAEIEPDESRWHVVDMGSTNGTWVNGSPVSRAPLRPGDVLAFGNVRFAVVVE